MPVSLCSLTHLPTGASHSLAVDGVVQTANSHSRPVEPFCVKGLNNIEITLKRPINRGPASPQIFYQGICCWHGFPLYPEAEFGYPRPLIVEIYCGPRDRQTTRGLYFEASYCRWPVYA